MISENWSKVRSEAELGVSGTSAALGTPDAMSGGIRELGKGGTIREP